MNKRVVTAVFAIALTGLPFHLSSQELADPDLQGMIAAAERQLESREYTAAERMAEDAIDRVERSSGRYHGALVKPLTLLGQARHGQGDFPAAIEAFERAIHVNRIDRGLHDSGQVEIVYKEAESWRALGELDRADDRQQYAFEVLRRDLGPSSPELVEGHFRMAQWYMDTFSIFNAREHYEAALKILETTDDGSQHNLIPALSGLAESYKRERLPPISILDPGPTFTISAGSSLPMPRADDERRRAVNRFGNGEEALRRIIAIHEEDPDATAEDLAQAYIDLADWHLIFERYNDATTLYRYAKRLWIERGGDEEVVNAYFAQAHPIYLPMPDAPSSMNGVPQQIRREGNIEMSYNVTRRGRTQRVTAVHADPAGVINTRAIRALRAAIFRPPLGENGLLAVDGQSLRHTFEYVPDSLRAAAADISRGQPAPDDVAEVAEEDADDSTAQD